MFIIKQGLCVTSYCSMGNIPIYFNLRFNDPKKNSFNVHQNALNASNLSVIITTPYVWVMIEILFHANNWLPFKLSIKTKNISILYNNFFISSPYIYVFLRTSMILRVKNHFCITTIREPKNVVWWIIINSINTRILKRCQF